MEKEDFIKRLTELRINKGVSARDMSLSIGQSAGYINNIENGVNLPSLLGIVFNGFCFINLIPHFFDYLMCPYYPAYTMGCYQIVIGGDNGG